MANDFVIEDGVLKKYNGPGGDVVVPEGVTAIGANAFTGCTGLTIHAPAKSKIIKYAAKNKIPFVEE